MADSTRNETQPTIEDAFNEIVSAFSGKATLSDIERIRAWRMQSAAHDHVYREAARFWTVTGVATEEWAREQSHPHTKNGVEPPKANFGRRAFTGAALTALAASAVAAIYPPLGLWPSIFDLAADYRTGPGERKIIALSEGSSVELNTRTSIDRNIRGATDEIRLIAGEAAISCHKSRPVVMTAADGQVSCASGTLNVRNDNANVSVMCLEGNGSVDLRGKHARLEGGQQIRYSTATLGAITSVALEDAATWRQGLLVFANEPLDTVIAEINRYRAGRIVLVNRILGERRVKARIELARLDTILDFLHGVSGASVMRLPGGMAIVS